MPSCCKFLPSVLNSSSHCGDLSYGKFHLWPWQYLRQAPVFLKPFQTYWFWHDEDITGSILQRVFVWRKTFLGCCKAEKASMGHSCVWSSSLSSPGRCSDILRCLQRAGLWFWELNKKARGSRSLLFFCMGKPKCPLSVLQQFVPGQITGNHGWEWTIVEESTLQSRGENYAVTPASAAVLQLLVLLESGFSY